MKTARKWHKQPVLTCCHSDNARQEGYWRLQGQFTNYIAFVAMAGLFRVRVLEGFGKTGWSIVDRGSFPYPEGQRSSLPIVSPEGLTKD